MVVCYHTGRQLRARSDCCAERGYHVVCLGIRGRTSLGLLHCSVGKSLSLLFSIVGKKTRTTRPTNDDVQSTILYSRFGNGIATNNLSKMLAGLLVPGRPVGNMYFAVSFTTYLSGYCLQRKPPLTMLLLGMVPQRDQQHSQLVERLENGRLS